MSIERFYKNTATITRLTRSADDTESWAALSTGVACHIQNWNIGERSNEGAYYSTHILWCDIDTDIAEADRVLIGSTTYQVDKVENRNYGQNQHKCVFLNEL